jgi:hypothetical protein
MAAGILIHKTADHFHYIRKLLACFLTLLIMNGIEKDGEKKQVPAETDLLAEAIKSTRGIQELHKGPDDPVVRENNNPDLQEKDGPSISADDAGE